MVVIHFCMKNIIQSCANPLHYCLVHEDGLADIMNIYNANCHYKKLR